MTSTSRMKKYRCLANHLDELTSTLDLESDQSQNNNEPCGEDQISHTDERSTRVITSADSSPRLFNQHQVSNDGEMERSFVSSQISIVDDNNISMMEISSSEANESMLSSSDDDLEPNPVFVEIDKNDRYELENGPFENKLRYWAQKHIRHVTHSAITDLLIVCRSEGYMSLPETSKTFLNTNKAQFEIRFIENDKNTFGEFCYFGIEQSLHKQLKSGEFTDDEIKLLIHVDGVSFYNKTKKSAHTILGLIFNSGYETQPFLIGLYYGDGKPNSSREFLNDLVTELNNLQINGVKIQNRTFAIKVSAFVCDTLARAFIKNTKGHTGFCACERCEVHGVTVEGKRVYGNLDAPERTQDSFRDQTQSDHHSGQEISLLLDILNFDIIKSVILDPMHLLYCGVAKTLLQNTMIHGKKCDYRLSDRQKVHLQRWLDVISKDIPVEFQRKKFDLDDISNWKATQFRFFLLYASGLVLEELLPENAYKHFMLLFTAVRMLSSTELAVPNAEKAKDLLRKFVKLMPTYCRSASQVMNFHNLIHIPDDVNYLRCSLEKYSAFVFENVYSFMKPLLKSFVKPIAQIARRVHELNETTSESVRQKYPLIGSVRKQQTIPLVKTREMTDNKRTFDIIKLNGMTLKTSHPDNIFILNDGSIIKIRQMFIRLDNGKTTGDIIIRTKKIKIVGDAFNYPVMSKFLGIYNVGNHSRQMFDYALTDIKKKCMLTTVEEKYFAIELLH